MLKSSEHATAVASRSAEVLSTLRRLEAPGLANFAGDTLVWARASGSTVHDADGNQYLDLHAGSAVAATGYCHPSVVKAVQEQAAVMMHCPSTFGSEVRATFLEAVAGIAPRGLTRIFPSITGTMADGNALAIARSRRPNGVVISFSGSYFGRSGGTVGLNGKSRYRRVQATAAGGQFMPFPYPLHMGADAVDQVMKSLRMLTNPAGGLGEIAAVIVEPVQANGGIVIPPDDFLPLLRAFCDEQDALLIFDEIQCGFGRTGRLWASDHAGVTPDLMTIGKGLGGGMPVTAVLGNEKSFHWNEPDSYSSTFLGNAVNLAAATAAIGVLRSEHLVERSRELGGVMVDDLQRRLKGVDGVAQIRARGLFAGIELFDKSGRPSSALAKAAVQGALARNVIVGRAGYWDNVVKLSPPLVISRSELADGVAVVTDSIRGALAN